MDRIGEMMGESKLQSYVQALHGKLGYQSASKQTSHKLMRLSLDLHNTRKEHLSKKETKQIRSVSQIEVTKSRSNSREKVEKRS